MLPLQEQMSVDNVNTTTHTEFEILNVNCYKKVTNRTKFNIHWHQTEIHLREKARGSRTLTPLWRESCNNPCLEVSRDFITIYVRPNMAKKDINSLPVFISKNFYIFVTHILLDIRLAWHLNLVYSFDPVL